MYKPSKEPNLYKATEEVFSYFNGIRCLTCKNFHKSTVTIVQNEVTTEPCTLVENFPDIFTGKEKECSRYVKVS